MTTFNGKSYKSHTSCISEAEKYQGALYKEKKSKSTPHTPMVPKTAYVEDASSPDLNAHQLARVDVPPPAPSPPSAVDEAPINVFDFLVPDGASQANTPTTASSFVSPKRSKAHSSLTSPYIFGQGGFDGQAELHGDEGVTYGQGPIEKMSQRYDSELDFNMQVDSQFGPPLSNGEQTPAPSKSLDRKINKEQHSESKSDKKRKRVNVEELDLSATDKKSSKASQPVLHSGLTGGLARLLGKSDTRGVNASPLDVKKRSKAASLDGQGQEKRGLKESESHHRKRHRREEESDAADESNDRIAPKMKAIEGRKNMKAIEYHNGTSHNEVASKPIRRHDQSSSEFFLSLVDKDYTSQKGQSIWGALKSFHEGVNADRDDDEVGSPQLRAYEEKRLFRGLRMKLNRHGEVVLFSLADRERSASPMARTTRRARMIEAP